MSCQWQMGMLVMRPCGAPASSGCNMCGRVLCMSHTVMGQNGPACPQCASMHQGYEENEETDFASSRDEYYRPYGGVPGFGHASYFSGADAGAMNRPGPMPVRRRQDEYDPMET